MNIAQRFIRAINKKVYKYMTSVSKNVYVDKLDDIVNKYNNIYRALNTKVYKYMISVSKNVCIDKLDDIVSKYNNLYHNQHYTIKMKPDKKTNTYIDSSKETNNEDPKFKIGDYCYNIKI